MKFRHIITAATMLSQGIYPVLAQTAPASPATPTAAAAPASSPPPVPAPPVDTANQASFHVRCDGAPALMTGGESFARFVGAVTLLGIFAPRPERGDLSKRLFGDAGVAACTQVIDGPHADGNGLRRLQLILARAVHRMEALDYSGAIADIEKARGEAKALKLIGNPYFDQSLGLSFDELEAQNTYLLDDGPKAREIGLRNTTHTAYSFMPMMLGVEFWDLNRTSSTAEDITLSNKTRVIPAMAPQRATRLEDLGRFAEAAQLRDASAALAILLNSETSQAGFHAAAAVSWALAGDWEKADFRAQMARQEIDNGDNDGKPLPTRAMAIEMLDFVAILKAAHDGHIDDARRNFAARSEWTAISFGANLAAVHLLREGAKPDQLTGGLAKSDDTLWQERHNKSRAHFLNSISKGQSTYSGILPFAKINEYEMVSRKVWKGDRSGVISENPVKNSRFYSLNPRAFDPIYRIVSPDALLLSAAIIAKARGFKGFVFSGSNAVMAITYVEFGNPGEHDMIDPFYLDADAVIAELRQLMPSPDELAAREKAVKS